jgi:hypothetical protein
MLSSDALIAQSSALDALCSHATHLKEALDKALCRELSPYLGGGGCGIYYPTFHTIDSITTAMNNAPRLAAAALAAHNSALSKQPAGSAMRPGTSKGGIAVCAEAVAAAAAAGAAAASAGASAVGATLAPATVQRVAAMLGAYEGARTEIQRSVALQTESVQAMQRWESAGRPAGPGGVLPVFAIYAYTRPLPALLSLPQGVPLNASLPTAPAKIDTSVLAA